MSRNNSNAPDVFDFSSSQKLLSWLLDGNDRLRGEKSRAANAMRCDLAVISRLLQGKSYLTLEQAERLAAYRGFNEVETDYLLTLVQWERSGTKELREYWHRKLKAIKSRLSNFKEKLGSDRELPLEEQALYYSDWIYCAIHVISAIPEFASEDGLGRALGLPLARIRPAVDWLLKGGYLQGERRALKPGLRHIHLGIDSPLLPRHQAQWRLRAMSAIEEREPDQLHFSGVYSLSYADVEKVRKLVVHLAADIDAVVKPSKEETALAVCLDVFSPITRAQRRSPSA